MMLMAWTLLSVMLVHARRPPATIPLPALTHAQSPVTLLVNRVRDLSESVVNAMVAETAAIWRPLGVELRRGAGRNLETSATVVRVIVTNDMDGSLSTEKRLGWIHFLSPNDPEPIVYVSRFAALQLLDSTARLRQYPANRRDLLLARMLGRALAHELGHYFLGSRTHTASGLMRSTWPLDLLIGDDRVGFGLPM